jgi:hypothetical protein
MTALVLAMAAFAFVGIFWARRLDYSEAHLLHAPDSGCRECEDK